MVNIIHFPTSQYLPYLCCQMRFHPRRLHCLLLNIYHWTWLVIVNVGAVVSNMIESLAASDTLPAPSLYHTYIQDNSGDTILNFRNLHFPFVVPSGQASADIACAWDYHTKDPDQRGILTAFQH